MTSFWQWWVRGKFALNFSVRLTFLGVQSGRGSLLSLVSFSVTTPCRADEFLVEGVLLCLYTSVKSDPSVLLQSSVDDHVTVSRRIKPGFPESVSGSVL